MSVSQSNSDIDSTETSADGNSDTGQLERAWVRLAVRPWEFLAPQYKTYPRTNGSGIMMRRIDVLTRTTHRVSLAGLVLAIAIIVVSLLFNVPAS